MLSFLKNYFELFIWIFGLIALYFMPVTGSHYSLCIYHHLGFTWCPGCGLGHSIHHYLHLNFEKGWEAHYLGSFALVILLFRIFQLSLKLKIKPNEQ